MSDRALDPAVRRHFADFYDGPRDPDRPLLLVIGNCQAESLRQLLDGDDVATARMPAVHELTETDLAPLHRLLDAASYVVMQPVADDYRGLRLGTAQLFARLRPHVRRVQVPGLRFAGLYPDHVLVHPPEMVDTEPPLVPYHDLRTLLEADSGAADPPAPTPLTPAAVRAVTEDSLGELRRREAEHDTVVVSDLLEGAVGFAAMRTINHPGNQILVPIAARLRSALGLPDLPADRPAAARPLLDGVHAPRDPVVADVLDPGAEPRPYWLVDGEQVWVERVRQAHLEWYACHPAFVAEALRRSAHTLALLGMGGSARPDRDRRR